MLLHCCFCFPIRRIGYTFDLCDVHYEEIMSVSAYLDRVLAVGATKAAVIADATLNNIYQEIRFHRKNFCEINPWAVIRVYHVQGGDSYLYKRW
ncbi:uncharacterized protein LOC122060055 isoform X2 [Macadamia integrifolia]|uniref:uncharacterized protein LOC122060055 isoform X2 n=1 Tax=Macadamia integrifolia TaxID=60698 RepID=UPI001C4F54C3|nr:uncharacterized protein LOC122060055 isoform X2 [Macadamia integrifolia]